MKNSNIGKTGTESLRINGMKIGSLPLGQGNEASAGFAEFLKTDKETKENNINAKFPKHKVEFLKSQIRECRLNIQRIKKYKTELKENILEYRQLIGDCAIREKELANCTDDKAKAKELRLKYPPYNIEALNQQILQFDEGIERCDQVIEKDFESISQIEKTLTLVEQREKELKNIN